jgi:hypothetical protein
MSFRKIFENHPSFWKNLKMGIIFVIKAPVEIDTNKSKLGVGLIVFGILQVFNVF